MRRLIGVICVMVLTCSVALLRAQKLNYPTEIVNGVECYLYPVEKSEGIWRIGKKFDVRKRVLEEYNPVIKDGLKLGQVLRIPVSEEHLEAERQIAKSSTEEATTSVLRKHVIQPKETLYRISKTYGVTIRDIVALNPEMSKAMHIGATLLIPPADVKMTPDFVASALQAMQDSAVVDAQELADSLLDATSAGEAIRVACLIPFMLDAPKLDASVARFVEFYQGVLLAINDKKNDGVRINLHVYDTEKTDVKVRSILERPEMKEMDLIIGPTYTQQITAVSQFAHAHKINTIVPFSSEIAGLDTMPNLFRFNITKDAEGELLAKQFVKNDDYAITYVHQPSISPSQKSRVVSKMIYELRKQDVKVKEFAMNTQLADSIHLALDSTKKNVLVFDTENFRAVQYMMPRIAALDSLYDVELVGHYSWLNHAGQIPVPFYYASLFNANAMYAEETNYDQRYKHFFDLNFTSVYPRYDMLGYDLTHYFISALSLYGKDALLNEVGNHVASGLLVEPIFQPIKEGGGMVNKHSYVFRSSEGESEVVFDSMSE